MKKILIALMCVVMTIAMMPAMAFATQVPAQVQQEVVPSTDVASITSDKGETTKYETLAAAFAAATEDQTIKLLADATITDTITTAHSVTLDGGAGFTITGGQYLGIKIGDNKTLTLAGKITFTGFSTTISDQGVLGVCTNSTAKFAANSDVTFDKNKMNNCITMFGLEQASVTVENGAKVSFTNNEANGMNGGNLTVNGGTVIATGNKFNGITAKVTMSAGSITATGNGKRGITLNGGTSITGGEVVATGNGKPGEGERTVSDIEINTSTEKGEVTFNNATVQADTMSGHAPSESVKGNDKVVNVQGNAVVNIKENAGTEKNSTAELFKKDSADSDPTDTFTSGVVIMPNKENKVEAVVKGTGVTPPAEFTGVDKVVVEGTLAEDSAIKVPAGTVVENKNQTPVKVDTPNGQVEVGKGQTITSQNPPVYIPTYPAAPSVQKPVITPNADVTTSLSADGTTLTVVVKDGYEVVDVTVNGVSKGAVKTVTGLKTGDKVVVVTKEAAKAPAEADKNEEAIKAIKATKLAARSKAVTLKSGKKAIKITWNAKAGDLANLDGVQIFRSTKKANGTYKKVFVSKSGRYINSAVKSGKMYYYKVRGYAKIGEKLYFTSYSTKAWRRV